MPKKTKSRLCSTCSNLYSLLSKCAWCRFQQIIYDLEHTKLDALDLLVTKNVTFLERKFTNYPESQSLTCMEVLLSRIPFDSDSPTHLCIYLLQKTQLISPIVLERNLIFWKRLSTRNENLWRELIIRILPNILVLLPVDLCILIGQWITPQ